MSEFERYDPYQETNENLPSSLISLDDYSQIDGQFDSLKYPKLASIVRLRRSGLPTLPGFTVKRLNRKALDYLDKWRDSRGAVRVSLRFDSPNPEDRMRLTLSNPTIAELSQMKDLIRQPVVGIVLAENDRFYQNHSVVTLFDDDRILLEIVGPGFDAADITRGKISPHEIIEINRKKPQDDDLDLRPIDITYHAITNEAEYLESRTHRYGVIYSVLKKGLGKSSESEKMTRASIRQVDDFLNQRGTNIPVAYSPLGFDQAYQLYSHICRLDTFREYYKNFFGINVEKRVLSSSFLEKHGLVFWDLYGADKYVKR